MWRYLYSYNASLQQYNLWWQEMKERGEWHTLSRATMGDRSFRNWRARMKVIDVDIIERSEAKTNCEQSCARIWNEKAVR